MYTTSAYPLRAQAIRVGVVLLYTAGLRRGELLRLTLRDYDPQAHTLLIRASKFHKSRLLPLSPDAVAGTGSVSRGTQSGSARHAHRGGPAHLERRYSDARIQRRAVESAFSRLARKAGVLKANGQPPRVHDVRHSFAVGALLRWYRAGLNVHAKLPLLSTYMGHVSIASTQYYLHFVEPVASAASERFAQHYGDLLTPHAQGGDTMTGSPTQRLGADLAPVLRRRICLAYAA